MLNPYGSCRKSTLVSFILIIGLVLTNIIDVQRYVGGRKGNDGPKKTTRERTAQTVPRDLLLVPDVFPIATTGNRANCTNVIYSVHTLDPTNNASGFVHAVWDFTANHLFRLFPSLSRTTCYVYFHVSRNWTQSSETGRRLKGLHPVWARLPATAQVMEGFPQANFFLYMDSDAVFIRPETMVPEDMYELLVLRDEDFIQESKKRNRTPPALVVNKPFAGWWCVQCMKFNITEGCFNTGVLLWRRSVEAKRILETWWEYQHLNQTYDFSVTTEGNDMAYGSICGAKSDECLFGWGADGVQSHMGEQNRLMYLFGTIPVLRDAIWSVPRNNTEPRGWPMLGIKPCLQRDYPLPMKEGLQWNISSPTCLINHFTMDKHEIPGLLKSTNLYDLSVGAT